MKRIVLLAFAFAAGSAGAVYKCVDEKGRTLIGDVPPEGCANVVMYEVSRTGTVLRKIDPTPTPEQEQRMREEQERRKAAERAAAEQKRRDMALLNTYSSEREIDVTRDRNIEPIRARIASAKERIDAVEKHQRQVENELEFYKEARSARVKGKTSGPPPNLAADFERAKGERATLEASIVQYEKEIEAVKARFEADKKRWIEVKGGAASAALPASAKAPQAKPVTKN